MQSNTKLTKNSERVYTNTEQLNRYLKKTCRGPEKARGLSRLIQNTIVDILDICYTFKQNKHNTTAINVTDGR